MKNVIAGMDIGFGHVKAYLRNGGDITIKISFPRVFAEAKDNNWGLNNNSIYAMEGDKYYIGNEALSYQENFIRHDYRDYTNDNTYWLCIAKVLMDSGVFDKTDNVTVDRLILGLAPGHYVKKNIQAMQKRAKSEIEFGYNKKRYRFTAKNVKVLPQGSGAFFSETLTDDGMIKEKNGHKKMTGILDIGYRTTDFLIFENGQFIGEKEELSEDTGIRVILEKLQSHIKTKFDKEEIEFIDPIMKGESFEFRGTNHDMSRVVDQLTTDHFHKHIEPVVLKRWEGRINRMSRIIICGGGAYSIKKIVGFLNNHEKQIFIPTEPEYSNAKGFFRYGMMQEKLKIIKTHAKQLNRR